MPLTANEIDELTPRPRPFKVFDGGGMYLYVVPNGSKVWRLKYRLDGRERLMTIGHYPEVSVDQARVVRDDSRALIRMGTDPVVHRRDLRRERQYLHVDPVERGFPRVSALPGETIEIATERRALRLTLAEAREVLNLLGAIVKEERRGAE